MPAQCRLLAFLMRHINPGIKSNSEIHIHKQKQNKTISLLGRNF